MIEFEPITNLPSSNNLILPYLTFVCLFVTIIFEHFCVPSQGFFHGPLEGLWLGGVLRL